MIKLCKEHFSISPILVVKVVTDFLEVLRVVLV